MSFVDITEKVRLASELLPLGGMVNSDSFTLDEAMSAIELMEPKMDPGYNIQEKSKTFKATKNRITSSELSETACCHSADILFGLLKQWLEGHLYIQTVHASVFMVERASLKNEELSEFCSCLLRLCSTVRQFVASSGLSDEEDFVGYMFDFNDESEDSRERIAPRVGTGCLSLHSKFLGLFESLLVTGSRSALDDERSLDDIVECLMELRSVSETRSPPSEFELELIESSVDPAMHRNLLPPGPPRIIPKPAAPTEIFDYYIKLFGVIRECLAKMGSADIESGTVSPFKLITLFGSFRGHLLFRSTFFRAFLYLRFVSVFKPLPVVRHWLSSFCGGSLVSFTKGHREETEAFLGDSGMVLQRIIFTLFRSSCRQHRSLKSNLSDLCILQHRAWHLHTRVKAANSQGLWRFTCALACTLIQLNFALSVELDLIDFETLELPLILFMMEATANVKLYVLNEAKVTELYNETLVAALEQSFLETAFNAVSEVCLKRGLVGKMPPEQLERIFELRSRPLQVFPLPKNVSLDEFLQRVEPGNSNQGADECLQWLEKVGGNVEGVILGSDIALVKKTVLNNKLMLLKTKGDAKLVLKYHAIIPCLVP